MGNLDVHGNWQTYTRALSAGISHQVLGAMKRAVVSVAIWVTWGYTCPVLLTTVAGLGVQSVAGGDVFCLWVLLTESQKLKRKKKEGGSIFCLCFSEFLCLSFSVSLTHTHTHTHTIWEAAACDRSSENKDAFNQELQRRCYDCCFSGRLCFMLIVLSERYQYFSSPKTGYERELPLFL